MIATTVSTSADETGYYSDALKFRTTEIPGVHIIDLQRRVDDRGFFARSFCAEELERQGLDPRVAQCGISHNPRRGTLRGMHYQVDPHGENKIVRCTRGAIFDVTLDLRPSSPTYRQWAAIELTAENRRAVYLPTGCAHGFQTLVDDSEVAYQMSIPYHPESVRGVRFDDPAIGIAWPLRDPILSDRDRNLPDLGG